MTVKGKVVNKSSSVDFNESAINRSVITTRTANTSMMIQRTPIAKRGIRGSVDLGSIMATRSQIVK